MEGDVGAQVAPPIFLHQPHPIRFHDGPIHAKKRDFPWQNPNNSSYQQQQINQWIPNPNTNWNPRLWDWDSSKFTAKPSQNAPNLPNLGSNDSQSKPRAEEAVKAQNLPKNLEEDGETLTLNLGGGVYSAAQEQAVRPSKRVRSGSPGSRGNYPMCQVDDCRADLSGAKDYHRRHKVCEIHSKTTRALVGKQMQRFCQQCSRFHPLSEFDEGKRSCRRRLAGHNRRRRKTQPEDVSSKLLTPGNRENIANGGVDIVNLLAVLAKLQGNNGGKLASVPSVPDKDRLVQILSKINSLSKNAAPKLTGFDLNVSQPAQESIDQSCKTNANQTAPSTTDLLAVLSSALAASASDVLASLSQGSSYSSGDDKTKMPSVETATDANSHSKPAQNFPSVGNGRPPLDSSHRPRQEPKQTLPLQLFGSAEEDSPPKFASSVKYFSSESSNPMDERSPSSSPPVAQKLFPLHSAAERKHERMSVCWEDDGAVDASTSHRWSTPLELFKESERQAENGVVHSIPYQGGYTSSSVSDHSPSSSNSDAQDRTGRIIFKLFDKDPSKIPAALRSQIVNWLAHSPSEMESYIRPGCVVLSIYASMPSFAWDELEGDLLHRINSLVQNSDSEFWIDGRFLVRTSRQLASHKDGKVRLCKSWRTWSAPEITSVSPVAVVSGQETSLVLKGRNLTIPGTKIHCTFMGGYTSKEVLGSAYPGTIYDDASVESFTLPGGIPNSFGRCFIEVENAFRGNSFPVIIANSNICQELRALESEFENEVGTRDVTSEEQTQDNGRPRSREDLLHFLNELGWLFQRKNSIDPRFMDFSTTRFKFLLTFSIERDWSSLIRTLLDILAERSLNNDTLAQESLEMLLEIQLLNRAVKRKCRKMVDLLLSYYVIMGEPECSGSKIYLFPPNSVGPGGITPLHLAASTQDSEDMVDALTNDPQEIGMNCWNSILDESGQTPYMYASQRNNHFYNRLVARKLADRKNCQVSINVEDEISMDKSWIVGEGEKVDTVRTLEVTSCSKCAFMEKARGKRIGHTRGLLERPYVHSMLAIAAVCVCVCLFFRGSPQIGSVAPFKWENLDFGPR
ncbi:squamosa promoter-binding-like protein 15 isoform X2 [Asparagus officinalis]|uniref:squamosa promoter-binding-like protein 15 isoform X2 n=1 Tax=Asparagus officinalis TaxID=4686 RepID=UPI00098DFC8C|nr:squamosa promoter-binding-like protein 15 isoform X2 [Asparagus officinalis]